MNRKLNRRTFIKWLGVVSVSAGFTIYGSHAFSKNSGDIHLKPINTNGKPCTHTFCRYHHQIAEGKNPTGYCKSKVYCRH